MSLNQILQPDGSPGAHGLTGAAHKRFVIITTLLSLIDPVRGEPTEHSLDRHAHDSRWKHPDSKKKFLDSFALICSTSGKGAETASAVCLEEGHPTGNVLRLARNCGVPPDLVTKLHQLLNDLAAIGTKEKKVADGEREILLRIIDLTYDKIWFLLEMIRTPSTHVAVQEAIRRLEADDSSSDESEELNFRQWIKGLPALMSLAPYSTPVELIPHMKWAAHAKWVYFEQVEALFCPEGEELPLWIKYIYKLARYYSATKAMVKLATKDPGFFTSIHVEAVPAPEQVPFSLGNDKSALRTTIQRLLRGDPEPLMRQIGNNWCTDDPEGRLRKACRLVLTVHAEMQLLAFYDHNPDLIPRLLFMGTSKKTCHLCNEFLSRHPLTIGVSSCHQKLYPSWMPAPCSSTVRKKHKELLWNLSRHLEETTLRDLETRLGMHRLAQLDSTAGPSLTTTGTVLSGVPALELSLQSLALQDDDSFSTAAVADG